MEHQHVYEKPQILELICLGDDIVRTSSGKDQWETPEF